ncbi:MAG TPA: hypothetical protein VEP90_12325 [Methylomirabilota bacterium]|nr:hypothetical protein [Methylomirabilota bacterium]
MIEKHIKVGEIIGYRCWEVVQSISHEEPISHFRVQYYVNESRMQYIWLRSFVSINTIWKPKIPISCCDEHSSWFWGVHAFKDPKFLVRYLLKMHTHYIVVAIGTVKLWGTVIEHEKGWRGEFGAIRSIDQVSCYNPQLLETLRKKYDVKEMENVE